LCRDKFLEGSLSGNYYLTADDYKHITIHGDYILNEAVAHVFTIRNREGNLIGKHVFPKDFTFQFRSSDLLFGFSYSSGPVLYKISLPSLSTE
jgi:hypothetical protein